MTSGRIQPRPGALLALLFLLTAPQRGASAQLAAESGGMLAPDPAVRRGVLPNGLTWYLRRNAYPAGRAELRLVVNAGSALEDEDQRGLAHLLEHLAFSGTPQFPRSTVWKFFERIGMSLGADLNATTGFDETIYQVTVPTDSAGLLASGITLLEEWAHRLTFDPEELARERHVVLEEWRTGLGAERRASVRQLETLLAGSRYPARLPIGDPDVVASAHLESIQRFYRDWYRPDRIAVVIVGDVDPDALVPLISTQFGRIPSGGSPRAAPGLAVPVPTAPGVLVLADSEFTSSSVSLVYRQGRRPLRTESDFRRRLAEAVFDDLLSERLHARALGVDPPFLGAAAGGASYTREAHGYQLTASVPEGGAIRGLAALVAEATRVTTGGFGAGELERGRTRLLRRVEQLADQLDRVTSAERADQLAADHLVGDPTVALDTQIQLARAMVPGLTESEVRAAGSARIRRAPPLVLARVPAAGPRLAEAELIAVASGQGETLGAYTERGPGTALLADLPAGGRVIRLDRVEDVGVVRMDLSNGVRVLLKPTEFDRGEVLLEGYRRGGLAVAPDSLLVPASSAPAVVCGSGMAQHDPVALTRLLAGRVVGLGCRIGASEEGVSGSSAPADLETLLQLVFLQFTAPRLDSQVVARYSSQVSEAVTHRGVDPATTLGDSLTLVLASHNPRTRLLDRRFLGELNADRSLAYFRERFGHATGFTFLLVGAFDADSVRPLVARYLGGLPAGAAPSSPVHPPSMPPEGTVLRVVRQGREPRSTTILVYHGESQVSREAHLHIAALTHVLRSRLEERLRRQLGAVYGVGVEAEVTFPPGASCRITIQFDADPARREELVAAVGEVVTALASRGPTADELAAFREERRRALETARRTNGWWLQSLALADQRGWPLGGVLSDLEAERLTQGDVRRSAERHLRGANLVHGVLLPE